MSEWKPIETAPKDGTAIIAFWPHLERPVVAWFGQRSRAGRGWIASHNTSYRSAMLHSPTHWMPLPEPPK